MKNMEDVNVNTNIDGSIAGFPIYRGERPLINKDKEKIDLGDLLGKLIRVKLNTCIEFIGKLNSLIQTYYNIKRAGGLTGVKLHTQRRNNLPPLVWFGSSFKF